jgi:hypothetical protein
MRTLLGLFVTGAIRRPRSGSGGSSSRQRASIESPTALAFHKAPFGESQTRIPRRSRAFPAVARNDEGNEPYRRLSRPKV